MNNINFKEFDKEELVSALELMISFNMLPSLEGHLIKTMSTQHFNRITDKRNKAAIEFNRLVELKQTKSLQNQISKLNTRIISLSKAREKRLDRMLEQNIITQEKYDELSLKQEQ